MFDDLYASHVSRMRVSPRASTPAACRPREATSPATAIASMPDARRGRRFGLAVFRLAVVGLLAVRVGTAAEVRPVEEGSRAGAAVPAVAATVSADAGAMPDHDGMAMDDMPGMSRSTTGQFGPYPMTREASGTSWQPDATPMDGAMTDLGDWSLMLHGFVNVVGDRQTGPRGADKTFTESMLMAMAQRPFDGTTLGLRAMVSLDPTMGKRGYPLLFQTGETADGRTPLVDRQHPHDALMEWSASWSVPLGDDRAAFAYVGLPGEPALGPPTYMHRFSAIRNPEAPLSHHWFDSTHVTFGVATLGATQGPWKIEGSWFNGREPDQARWNVETRRFDSWSARLSYNPTPAWAFQVSYGYLRSPEQLEPDTSVRRLTASAMYQAKLGDADWGTTVGWARNDAHAPDGRSRLPAFFVESTAVRDRHTVFARAEQVDKDELFDEGEPLHGRAFVVRKATVGYLYDVVTTGPVRWAVGGSIGAPRASRALDGTYGRHPMSYLVFLQGRLGAP